MMAFILEALLIISPWLTNSQDSKSSHHDKRIQVSRDREYLLLERTMQLERADETTLISHFTSTPTALVKELCSQNPGRVQLVLSFTCLKRVCIQGGLSLLLFAI